MNVRFTLAVISVLTSALSFGQQPESDEAQRKMWMSADLKLLPPHRMMIAPKTATIDNVDQDVKPAFANDGIRFAYAKQDGSKRGNYLVVSDLVTLRPIKELTEVSIEGACVFAPDDKRIFLRDLRGRYVIVDTVTWQVMVLPVVSPNGFLHSQFNYSWTEPMKIRLLIGDIQELDLESLQTKQSPATKEQIDHFSQRSDSHPSVTLVRYDSNDCPPSVLADSNDKPFAQILRTPHYAQEEFYPHPTCHVFISKHPDYHRSSYVLHYIIEGPDRNLRWQVKNPAADISAEQKKLLKKYIDKKVPFYASVYGAAINPLTGKVTGPDGKKKGRLRIVEWTNTHLYLDTSIEVIPFKAGDLVTGIVSDGVWDFGNRTFGFDGFTDVLEAR